MNLTPIKVFFCRSDVRIIIFGTVTGGVLQILARRYIKKHPELFKDSPESKDIIPRGGEVISSSLLLSIISFLAENGLIAGSVSSISLIIQQIPINSISTVLHNSMPQNFSDLERKKFILVKGSKIYFNACDENLKYLFDILGDETIPFEERKKIAHSVLTKYLNLKTPSGRLRFVICIVFIICILNDD